MLFYMAPMEGLTGYIFRNAYHKYFNDIDKYFTPFIASKGLNHKELNDILPEHNEGMNVVPQILTNNGEEFLVIARRLAEFGYESVNLNLGCPSGTVVAKKRGAGLLAYPEELERLLHEIFEKCPLGISIKTRIGLESPEEWERLQRLYETFPVEELIIHPRVQKDFYKNHPDWEVFGQAAESWKKPLCYNGDIASVEDYRRLTEAFPGLQAVMLGRGIIGNPGLAGELRGKAPADRERLKAFHDEVLAGYEKIMSGDRNTLYKMKELWVYLGSSFPGEEKSLKKIRKASSVSEYRIIADNLFRNTI